MMPHIPVSTLVFANSLCIRSQLNPKNPFFWKKWTPQEPIRKQETIKYGHTIAYLLQHLVNSDNVEASKSFGGRDKSSGKKSIHYYFKN